MVGGVRRGGKMDKGEWVWHIGKIFDGMNSYVAGFSTATTHRSLFCIILVMADTDREAVLSEEQSFACFVGLDS